MKLLGTVRSRLVFCGLATLAVVLLASGSAWMGYQAISAANENALRYANQATVLQTLIKDINQLITTEGAKAVRTRMADTLQRLDAELSAGGEAGASESGDVRKKRLALWADLKVGVAALLTEAKISVENDEVLVKVIKLVTRLDGLAEEVNALASKSHDDGNALARQTVLRVGGLFALVLAVVAAMFVLLYRSLFKDLGGEPGYAREVAQRIKEAREFGDISENAELDAPRKLPPPSPTDDAEAFDARSLPARLFRLLLLPLLLRFRSRIENSSFPPPPSSSLRPASISLAAVRSRSRSCNPSSKSPSVVGVICVNMIELDGLLPSKVLAATSMSEGC